MTNDTIILSEIRDALINLVINIEEDVPFEQMSKHLISAINYAHDVLTVEV